MIITPAVQPYGAYFAKDFLSNDLLKITVTPLIEYLNPGESVILTAKITYPDGTEINTSDLEEMTWSWSVLILKLF